MKNEQNRVRGIVSVRADASVTANIEAVNKAFAEFKASNEEALKSKVDDVVLADRMDKINATIGDLQSAIDLQNERAALAASKPGVVDAEYTSGFQAHIRKGDVQASLNKGANDEGGYLAPEEWDRTITDKLKLVSPMRRIAQVQSIGTNGFSKLFNNSDTASGWVGEAAARTATGTGTFGSLSFTPGELYANVAATQGLLDDALVDLEAWIAGEVEREFAQKEGAAFVSGDGTNKPYGFLGYVTGGAAAARHPFGAIALTNSGAAAAISADNIIDLSHALPSEMTAAAVFAMNRATHGVVRKFKDTTGQYLWQPSMQAGQPATLAGFPVIEMADMPNVAANALPIAFGDFGRGYLIVDRVGTRVLRDPYTNKPYVMFYITKRVGGGVQNPEAIKVLKVAT